MEHVFQNQGIWSTYLTFGARSDPTAFLTSFFDISIWLPYIKIDSFHGLSIKMGQKWKKLLPLTFGSSEQSGKLISKFHL